MSTGLDIDISGSVGFKVKTPKIVYFLGLGSYFLSHRLPTAFAAMDSGYEVHVVAIDDGVAAEIEGHGVIFHARYMQNNARPIVASLFGLIQLLTICLRIKPSVLHFIGLKSSPVGLVSALFLRRSTVLFSINGLGYLFSNPHLGFSHSMVRRLIITAFAIVSSIRNFELVFQNVDDKALFETSGCLRKAECLIVPGSGVDTSNFHPTPLPPLQPTIIFGIACRMVEIKGVRELIAATTQLQDDGVPIKLILAGDVDHGNPSSLSREQLTELCGRSGIEWRGFVDDMRSFWSECHVAVLPSHGGEGLPMALLMAAAMGRPLVASDTNGNRDLIVEGKNGYLCEPRDVNSLKTAIRACLSSDLSKLGNESIRIIKDRGMDSHAVRQKFRLIYGRGG